MTLKEIFVLIGSGICFAGSVFVNLYTLLLLQRCHEMMYWIMKRFKYDAD